MAEAQVAEGVADMMEFKAQVPVMKRPKRPAESKPQAGSILQTGSLLTDSTGIDLLCSFQAARLDDKQGCDTIVTI